MIHPVRCPGCATLTDPFEIACTRCGAALSVARVEPPQGVEQLHMGESVEGVHVNEPVLGVVALEAGHEELNSVFHDAMPYSGQLSEKMDTWPRETTDQYPPDEIPFWDEDGEEYVIDVLGHATRPRHTPFGMDVQKMGVVIHDMGDRIWKHRKWAVAGGVVLLLGTWILAAVIAEPVLTRKMPTHIESWHYNVSLSASARGDATSLLSGVLPSQVQATRLSGVYSFAAMTVHASDPESLIIAVEQTPALEHGSFAQEQSRIMTQVNEQGFQAIGEPVTTSDAGTSISCYQAVDGNLGVNGVVCMWKHRDVLGVTVRVSQGTHSTSAAARTTAAVVTALLH